MNYQELVSLVGGNNPQSASYQDIVSGIQSQYRPQTEFLPTRSLLDSMGTLVPDQPRIAYGSLLQALPRTLPPSINLGASSIKNPNAAASVDSGVINLGNLDTGKITGNTAIDNTLVYNNDFTKNTGATDVTTNTTNNGLFGTNVTGTDVAKVGSVVAPIAALAGNSDLVKTAVALNLIGSAADIKTEQDVINLGTRIAMLAAGPSGNALAAGLGLATNNTPLTANALLSIANPTLGLINSIVSNLTGNSFGNVVSGLLTAPEGSISDLGLLGASDYGNAIDRSYADVNDVLRDSFSGGGGGGIKDYWNRAINAE
jgi:hypothetical protein